MKDAARLARDKSQDKELANTALSIAAPQVSVAHCTPTMAPFRGSRLLCTSGLEGKERRAVSDLARWVFETELGSAVESDCAVGKTTAAEEVLLERGHSSPRGRVRAEREGEVGRW